MSFWKQKTVPVESKDAEWLQAMLNTGGEYTHRLSLSLINDALNIARPEGPRLTSEEILADLLECNSKEDYFEGYSKLLAQFPLRSALGKDSVDFHRQQFKFALAHLLGYRGEDQRSARRCMTESAVVRACTASDLPLYIHQLAAEKCRIVQCRAIDSGMPSILMVSLPKSASAYISNSLAQVLKLADLRASFCDYPSSIVHAPWVQHFLAGGAVSHEHIPPTDDNVNEMIQSGVRKLFIQVRDPRAAAFSLLNMSVLYTKGDVFEKGRKNFVKAVQLFSEWIEGWIKVAHGGIIQTHFIKYPEIQNDSSRVFRYILENVGLDSARFIQKFEEIKRRPNFYKGDDSAVKDSFPASLIEESTAKIPQSVRELLEIQN